MLQNLITANHRKNDERTYDRKLAEIDFVTNMNPVPCKRGQLMVKLCRLFE